MSSYRGLLLFGCLVLAGGTLTSGNTAKSPGADEASAKQLGQLIAALGSANFAEREQATQALDAIGEPALDPLRKAAESHADAEVRRRARGLVTIIEARALAARAFARQVFHLIQVVSKDSVTEVGRKELTAWAIEALYQGLNERVPPPIAERLSQATGLSEDEARTLLRDARVPLDGFTELYKDRDFAKAVRGMLARFDPHAGLSDEEAGCFWPQQAIAGIGVRLEIDTAAKLPRVITPIRGSPVRRAGVEAGDLITHITRLVDADGQPLQSPEVLATEGLSLDQVNRAIVGREGTPVRLTVRRAGAQRPLEFAVVRGRVELESVLGSRRKNDDSWDYLLDARDRIGYVRIPAFARNSAADLDQALDGLTRDGLKGLILDLRSSPGGLLKSAIDVADRLIDDGTIVTFQSRLSKPQVCTGERKGSRLDFPLVCLIDRDSVSGSEIVAACLQDHQRAVIVGERSHGKGSAQNLTLLQGNTSLNGSWELKLTIAVFLRPSGRKIDRIRLPGRDKDEWGVTPDRGFGLELPPDERTALLDHLSKLDIIPRRDQPAEKAPVFKDRQRELALEHLRAQIRRR